MVQQLSKAVVEDTPALFVVDGDSSSRHILLDSKCKVVTINGRVLVGILSYIGHVHVELNTDKGKLLVMFSSVEMIEEC